MHATKSRAERDFAREMTAKDTVFRDVTIRTLRRNLSAFWKKQISDGPTLFMIQQSINRPQTKSVVSYTSETNLSLDHLRIQPMFVFVHLTENLLYKEHSRRYISQWRMGGIQSRHGSGSAEKDT
jgi:hypothetical protein